MNDAYESMIEYSKNYHEQFLTRAVITEKTKPQTDETNNVYPKFLG